MPAPSWPRACSSRAHACASWPPAANPSPPAARCSTRSTRCRSSTGIRRSGATALQRRRPALRRPRHGCPARVRPRRGDRVRCGGHLPPPRRHPPRHRAGRRPRPRAARRELAARMEDRFALLTSGRRTAEARQRTLRATVDWSHDLLTEPERVLLRRLSVFRGHVLPRRGAGRGERRRPGRTGRRRHAGPAGRPVPGRRRPRRRPAVPPAGDHPRVRPSSGWRTPARSSGRRGRTSPTSPTSPSGRRRSCEATAKRGGCPAWPPNGTTSKPLWPGAPRNAGSRPDAGLRLVGCAGLVLVLRHPSRRRREGRGHAGSGPRWLPAGPGAGAAGVVGGRPPRSVHRAPRGRVRGRRSREPVAVRGTG